jgi:CheY-like chemotaxis protein
MLFLIIIEKLIFLDYKLGDTTGDYVAHKIKELNDVKIIMITAYEVNHDIVRQLEDNELVIDIVQKPTARFINGKGSTGYELNFRFPFF